MIWRYRLALALVLLAFAGIILRLFYWQVVKAQDLSILGQAQYEKAFVVSPQRGEIRTSDNFPIATDKISYLLFANPKLIKEKENVSILLSSALGIEKSSVSAQLSMDKFWVPIKKGLDSGEKEKVEMLKIPGLGFDKTYTRLYPEASMAAHLLGFVGKDDLGKNKGYFGLEGYYDRLLRGKDGTGVELSDALGGPILQGTDPSTGDLRGRSLVLNIDRTIQFIVEKKLKASIERFGAAGGMVGVMDPKTGKILAISAFPSFSPLDYGKFEEKEYKNPFISNLYEPGSTLKPLIMSAAFDANLVTPQTRCNMCGGPVSIGGYEIKTWNDKYRKDLNMAETIQYSDNTGMIFVGKKLGIDRMTDYLDKFGIGKNTGIDLQGEVSQPVPDKEFWYEVDVATRAFGQGISITPIELLDAFSSIANKGIRMEPQVVASVETEDGKLLKINPKILGRTISAQSAKVMTEILVNA
ncbi:MAG: penicillin-binding protein 2, partial [Patescibacteria group bacterium]